MTFEMNSPSVFGLALGGVFLIGKLCIKHGVHALCGKDNDPWTIVAWFGVDLAALSLSGAMVARVFELDSYHETVFAFILGVVGLAFCAYCYGRFLKRRLRVSRKCPARDARMAASISAALFVGSFELLWLADRLMAIGGRS